jgi:hypothetical protein
MRRILLVLSVAALMAAMLAASAMPAFAAVKIKDSTSTCFVDTRTCTETSTRVGGSKDSTFNGRSTGSYTTDFGDENFGGFSVSGNNQGGGKGTGGGNCTFTQTGNLLEGRLDDPVIDGNGSRCRQ